MKTESKAKLKGKKPASFFECKFRWLPWAGVLMFGVFKTGHPEVMHFVWPLIWLMIEDPDEAFDKIKCLCTLNRVIDNTDDTMPSFPAEGKKKASEYAFKWFCCYVDELPTSANALGKKLDKICANIVKGLNEIGAREWNGVSLIVGCTFQCVTVSHFVCWFIFRKQICTSSLQSLCLTA